MMINSNKWMLNTIFLCPIFFHAVGFIPNIDVQPTFFIFTTIFLLIYGFNLKYNLPVLILFFICFVFVIAAYIFQSEYLNSRYSMTYIIPLFTVVYLSILLKNGYIYVSSKIIYLVVAIYTLVGIIQFFIPDFLSFLVTRHVDAAFSFSQTGRGVRSLTGEPAHLGKIFSLLNVFLIFIYLTEDINKNTKKKILIATISLFMINVVISRSAYAIAFHALVVFFVLYTFNKKIFLILNVLVILLIVLFLPIMLNIESDLRFVKLFVAVINNPDFLMSQGAIQRLFNVPVSFNNMLYFDWFGAGNNPYTTMSSIQTPFGRYFYIVKNRGYGGYFEFVLKFGFLSLPIVLSYLYSLFIISKLKISILGKKTHVGFFFVTTIFILTVQDGTPVNPLPYLLILYIFFNRKQVGVS